MLVIASSGERSPDSASSSVDTSGSMGYVKEKLMKAARGPVCFSCLATDIN